MIELMLKLLTYESYEKVSGNEKDYIDIDNVYLLKDDSRQELFIRLRELAVKMNISIVTTLDVESCVDNRSSHQPVLSDV